VGWQVECGEIERVLGNTDEVFPNLEKLLED